MESKHLLNCEYTTLSLANIYCWSIIVLPNRSRAIPILCIKNNLQKDLANSFAKKQFAKRQFAIATTRNWRKITSYNNGPIFITSRQIIIGPMLI